MREFLIDSARRERMPIWAVSRLCRRPDGVFFLPVGKWRAWTKDEAIEKAAYAIQGIAVLTAERFFCGSQQEKGK